MVVAIRKSRAMFVSLPNFVLLMFGIVMHSAIASVDWDTSVLRRRCIGKDDIEKVKVLVFLVHGGLAMTNQNASLIVF